MLVQQLHFEEIYINFLIVNHTHNIIDQYFSILSKALGPCNWVGSQMSLVNLFDVCHSDESQKPGVQRELKLIYDVVKAWKPYINEDIKYCSALILDDESNTFWAAMSANFLPSPPLPF
jgi:hypothetical protein